MRKIPFRKPATGPIAFHQFLLVLFIFPFLSFSFVFTFQSQMWIKYEKKKIFCLLLWCAAAMFACVCVHSHVAPLAISGLSCLPKRNRNDANAIRMANGDAARKTFHSQVRENRVCTQQNDFPHFPLVIHCTAQCRWCDYLILVLHTQVLRQSRCSDEFSCSHAVPTASTLLFAVTQS